MTISNRRRIFTGRLLTHLVSCIAITAIGLTARTAVAQDSTGTVGTLKRMSLEELLDLEVNLVSKTPQKLSEVPSAIQVITSEDIRRSGATRLPEALRLAANLMVAQSNSHDWAITARGFNGAPLANNTLANKLLVMIDGRTIYSPLFGGVFWDVQNVLLEDIDRIEIISGPGGALWGANAVNGVINIITKSSLETKGIYASAAGGDHLNTNVSLRYGGSIGSRITYRVYGNYMAYDHTLADTGVHPNDAWKAGQGGFRVDYAASAQDAIMLSGDFYGGTEGDPTTAKVDGQNILGRWTHQFSESSSLVAQLYFDRTWRDLPPSGFNDDLKTYDIDLQHGFSLGRRHRILYGLEYRLMQDQASSSPGLSFLPPERKLQLFTGFLQDQISIIPRRLELSLGIKVLYNDYSHADYHPSLRVAFITTENHTLWAAVSRAVRTPTRFDADELTPFIITPDQRFASEKVIAYEVGHRGRVSQNGSFSLAAFYNQYDDLRSININRNAPPGLIFANDQQADSYGIELSGNYLISKAWRLRGGYTLFDKKVTSDNVDVVPGSDQFEGIDPRHQFVLQSLLDIPSGFSVDFVLRYVSALNTTSITPEVSEYFGLDLRLAKSIRWFELSLVGQNLLQQGHVEFGALQIPRSIFIRLSYRLLK